MSDVFVCFRIWISDNCDDVIFEKKSYDECCVCADELLEQADYLYSCAETEKLYQLMLQYKDRWDRAEQVVLVVLPVTFDPENVCPHLFLCFGSFYMKSSRGRQWWLEYSATTDGLN